MELLNHLVAARLMKDAERFERIAPHGTPRLQTLNQSPSLSVVGYVPQDRTGAAGAANGSRPRSSALIADL